MRSQSRAGPALRLVNTEGVIPATPLRQDHTPPAGVPRTEQRRRDGAVAAENLAASSFSAGLSALDPRWIFAVQVERAVQGGRAGAISPDARAKLLATAERLSIRPFDANLVIAIVQDAARRGEDALGCDVEQRLRLVRGSEPHTPRPTLATAGAVTLLAMGAFALLQAWLLRG